MSALAVLALAVAAAAMVTGSVVREREVPARGAARHGRTSGALGLVALASTAAAVLTMVTSMLLAAL